MRRIILISAAVLSTCLRLSAYDFKVDRIAYNVISGNEVEVTQGGAYDDEFNKDLVIPTKVTYDGVEYFVTRIGDEALYGCRNYLKSVVVPEGVTTIGHDAFYDCYYLESVKLPSTLTKIDFRAFMYNFRLNNVVIPEGVEEIGNYAFYGERERLTNITLPEGLVTIGDRAFGQCYLLKFIEIPSTVTSIGNDIFESTSIDSIVFNGKLSKIGSRAFPAKVSFTELPLDNTITIIPDYAFENCSGLKTVLIPSSVTTIGNYAFSYCKTVDYISVTESVHHIGNQAFNGCNKLSNVDITGHIGYLGSGLFNDCSNLEVDTINNICYCGDLVLEVLDKNLSEYIIRDGTRYIGREFQNCHNMESITIPSSVISVDEDAFKGCENLPVINGIRYADKYLLEVVDKTQNTYTIKEGTKWIAKNAFSDCTMLSSITIPSGVSSIGESCFSNCSSLLSVNLPSSIEYLGQRSFIDCSSLSSFIVPEGVDNIGDDTFRGCTNLASLELSDNVKSIGIRAFYGCSTLTSISIPDKVNKIEDDVFANCTNLSYVELGNSVSSLGIRAFYKCQSLTSIIIPDGVISIGESAFYDCEFLESITIPSSVSEIGYNRFVPTFGQCNKLNEVIIESPYVADNFYHLFREGYVETSDLSIREISSNGIDYAPNRVFVKPTIVVFPEGTKRIPASSFWQINNLKSFNIPSTTTFIGFDAFRECSSLITVTIPYSVSTVGNNAFYGCSSLVSITIPESVSTIGSYAFYGCSSLVSITIPEGVTRIKENTFVNCSSLRYISLPSSISSFYNDNSYYFPFRDCSNLDTIIVKSQIVGDNYKGLFRESAHARPSMVFLPEGTSKIDDYAFDDCRNMSSFIIPSTVKSIGTGAFNNCSSLISLLLSDSITSISDYCFYGCSSLTTLLVPDGVKSIGNYTFYGCSSLTSLLVPDGVTSIGNYAFYDCSSLSSIVLPNGLSSIGSGVLYGCRSLKKIVVPESVSEFGANSFMGCTALDTVIIHSPMVADNFFNIFRGLDRYNNSSNYINVKPSVVVFPEGTTIICDNAFRDMSNLKSFTIPSTVTDIGAYAFYCCSLLTLNIPHGVDKIGNNALFNVYSIFESDTPATLESESLLGELGVAVVSAESFEAYRQADYWHSFMAKIVRSDQISRIVTANASETTSGLHIAVGEDNLNSVMDLTIKGSINGLDLLVIRNKMKNLRNLDLSEASIVANDNMFNYYEGGVIKADNELGARAFKDLTIKSIVLPNNLVAIGDNAFYNCTGLTSVYIADNVRTIGEGAFRGCSQLTDLHMSSNIREIKNFAFYGAKIDTIVFGDSLQIIGSNAFRDVSTLKAVSLGDGITSLSSEAFRGCSSLESLYLGRKLSTIGNGAFYDCRSLTNVIIPNSTKSIGSEAFRNCSMIDTLVIGHGVETIGSSAFYGCSNIADVTFGKSIREIGSYAFENCSNIQKISLPTSLKYIRQRAFANCTGLREFRIPSSVLLIENEAFAGNRKLDAVYAYTIEPISIAQNTFSCWDFATLYVPKTSYYTYYLNTQWSQFMTLREFDEPYEYFYLNDDYLLDTITGRIDGVPDMLLNENSAIIVEGDETQEIAEIELMHNGTDGASIIGGNNDFTGKVENLTAKSMKVNIGVDGNRWYFFCFPFDVMHDSIECSAEYVIQTYDGAKRAEKGTGWVKLESDFTSLQKGQGYIFQTSRAGVLTIHVSAEYLTFTASNEKEILHTYASNDVSNASWNFIGNPFISYYDVQDLAKEYDAPIIVWNGKGYDVYKPGDDDYMLKPFETFFVQRIDGVQYVELLPENKLTYNQATTRSSLRAARRAAVGTPMNLDRQLVNIMLMGQDSVTDRTRIVYSVNASMDYEIGVDAAKFQADGVPQLYTLNGKTKYAINERPMGTDEIKLGYTAPKAGTYTLSVPRHDAEIEIYDNVAKSKVDFTFGDYSFQSQAGTFNDRFVVYKTSGGVTKVDNGFRMDGMTVKTIDGGIVIEGNLTGKVQVYSDSGMLLAEPRQAGRVDLGDGVYIIKMGDKSVKMSVN